MSKASRLKQKAQVAPPAPDRPSGGSSSFFAVAGWDGKALLQAILIVATGLWVFWPSVHGQWIGDDSWYILDNPLLKDPARLWKAWFEPGSWVEYYPVQETVQWVQWKLWGTETFGYHLTNLVLHLTSALLVWKLLGKFGLRWAWLGGLIFAVHPMTVDSVALMNEEKTALSLPPFLLAMCAWIDYEENRRLRDYLLALGFFVIAMLCKITMAAFPIVILLYAWWKRGNIGWRDLKVSAPFFAISFVLGKMTIWAGEIYAEKANNFVHDAPIGDFLWRFVLSGENIAFYFSRCFLPITPMPIYPQWKVDLHAPMPYLPWVVLAGLIGFLWTRRKTWGRHALLGLGFFLVMLGPFWGWHWISYMNATWVLEHLLYIPMLGLLGLVVAGVGGLEKQLPPPARRIGAGLLVILIGLLAWQSHLYAEKFESEETMAAYNLQYNPNSSGLRNNLGVAYARQSRWPEAVGQFELAVRLDPLAANVSKNLGDALQMVGRVGEAVGQQEITVRLRPNWGQAHRSLGNSLMQAGRVPEAIIQFKEWSRLNPDAAWIHYELGLVLRQDKQLTGAIEEYQKALALDPNYAEAHNSLAIVLFLTGRPTEAREHFEQALRIKPGYIDARNNLARLEAAEAAGPARH